MADVAGLRSRHRQPRISDADASDTHRPARERYGFLPFWQRHQATVWGCIVVVCLGVVAYGLFRFHVFLPLSTTFARFSGRVWPWSLNSDDVAESLARPVDESSLTGGTVTGSEVVWVPESCCNLESEPRGGQLAAYGDVHSARGVDMIFFSRDTLAEGPFKVIFRSWNAEAKSYETTSSQIVLPKEVENPRSAAALDIDGDGAADLYITHVKGEYFDFLLYRQELPRANGTGPSNFKLIYSSASASVRSVVEPIAIDLNFDGLIDFVGQVKPDVVPVEHAESGGRFVYRTQVESLVLPLDEAGRANKVVELIPLFWTDPSIRTHLRWNNEKLEPLVTPGHHSAYIDMDGDCIPDMVIDSRRNGTEGPTRQLEVWLSTPLHDSALLSKRFPLQSDFLRSGSLTGGVSDTALRRVYVKSQFGLDLPDNSRSIFYGDFTGSGTIDVGVVTCVTNAVTGGCEADDKISIYANRQPPICPSGAFEWLSSFGQLHEEIIEGAAANAGQCRKITNACVPRDLDWDEPNVTPLSTEQKVAHFHLDNSKLFNPVQVGDVNLDGFDDIIVMTSNNEALVLSNRMGPVVQPGSQWPWLRWLLKDRAEPTDPSLYYHRSIFDFTARISLPTGYDRVSILHSHLVRGQALIVASRSFVQAGGGSWWHPGTAQDAALAVFRPNKSVAPFFLSTAGLSGGCLDDDCSRSAAAVGGTFKLVGTDLEGRRFARIVSQLHQTQHSPLKLPYTVTGLGNLNNYIDFVYYGLGYVDTEKYAAETQRNHRRWSSIVPNSYIYVNPRDRADVLTWRLMLSVNPSGCILQISLSAIVILVIVGSVVIYLQWKEKSEVQQEVQGFRRHFISA